MSADHRKPAVAFTVLAFTAAALVGIQRADAETGRFLSLAVHGHVVGHGTLPLAADNVHGSAIERFASLAPGRDDMSSVAGETQGSGNEHGVDADRRHGRASHDGRPSRGAASAVNGGRGSLASAENAGQKALSDTPRTPRTDSRADRSAWRSGRPADRHSAGDPGLSGSRRSSVGRSHDAERDASSVSGRSKP